MKYPIVKIEWRDSYLYHDYESIKHATQNYEVAVMSTAGHLIKETKDSYMVARELVEKLEDVRSVIVIPKENVVSFKTYK